MAHCQGVIFVMTYTGAIVCRKDVNHTCIEEIWMKAERRNAKSWAYERVGPYVPTVCTPTIDPCVRWAICSTVVRDDVRAGIMRKRINTDPGQMPQGSEFEKMSKAADVRAENFFREFVYPYR